MVTAKIMLPPDSRRALNKQAAHAPADIPGDSQAHATMLAVFGSWKYKTCGSCADWAGDDCARCTILPCVFFSDSQACGLHRAEGEPRWKPYNNPPMHPKR
jgi:hypothetical protein